MINRGDIGRAIKELRVASCLSQEQVAHATELSVNYVSLVENGHRVPPLETINLFAKVFEVPTSFITFLAESGTTTNETANQLKVSLNRLIKSITAMKAIDRQDFGA